MFSGKTEELIRRLRGAHLAGRRVTCFKPDLDRRYHSSAITSHSAQSHTAHAVPSVEHLREQLWPELDRIDVVGIDEAQFFDDRMVPITLELMQLGRRVVLAGLDMTFAGEPFGAVPTLMAIADEVTKLSAVCTVCGEPAIHTQRLIPSTELVVVGAAGLYEARCRTHFHPVAQESAMAEQLELPDGGNG